MIIFVIGRGYPNLNSKRDGHFLSRFSPFLSGTERRLSERLHNPSYLPPFLSGGQRHAAPRLHKPYYLPVLIRHGEASL